MTDLEVLEHLPTTPAHTTPLLFVHGAWHAAWCWQYFLSYFAHAGYAAYALSFRGHGASTGHAQIRWYRLTDYVADIAHVARSLPAPPVVIGHSMGGFAVQKYLETHCAPAAVLLASLPVTGSTGWTFRCLRRHPLKWLQSLLTFNPRALVDAPHRVHELLFSPDMPPRVVQLYGQRLQQESVLVTLDTAVHLPEPARIRAPVLVLGAANDHIVTSAELRVTAHAYGIQAHIYPNMAHDMMLERNWHVVAQRMREWLQEQGIP